MQCSLPYLAWSFRCRRSTTNVNFLYTVLIFFFDFLRILFFFISDLTLQKFLLNYFADMELPVACLILIILFGLQHYGTHRIGHLFAPIILVWLLCIGSLGLYNIFQWNVHIYKALNPYYMWRFLKKTQHSGWLALGGTLLCITGSFLSLNNAQYSLFIYKLAASEMNYH